jgi:N-acetyl-anhydromuramyl-L-alanine amidase AmpD
MAVWMGSPNYNAGRNGSGVDRIVIHYIVGTRAAADATFADAASQVSAHYGIGEGAVHQYVSEADTAWHAGDLAMNRRSIGIEHSADQSRPPEASTYAASVELCARICRDYGLDPRTQIIGHSSVVSTSCPGTVDLQRIVDETAAAM